MADESRQPTLPAEQGVIGGIFLSRGEWATTLSSKLKPSDFYDVALGRGYGVLVEMVERGTPVDEVTFAAACAKSGLDVDDDFLEQCSEATPDVANTGEYAKLVLEASHARRIAALGAEMQANADGRSPFKLIAETEAKLAEISANVADRPFVTDLSYQFDEMIVRVEELMEGGKPGVDTGIDDLDVFVGGLRPGQFVVIGARPGMGKTSLGLDITRHVAVEEGQRVLFASMEMSPTDLAIRIASQHSQVPMQALFNGTLDERDWDRVLGSVETINDAPISFLDAPALTVGGLASEARRIQKQHGDLGLVVVDYLQLLTGREGAESKVVEVSEMSRSLKLLARELEVPVVALSQLSRNLENRSKKDKRPMLSDLRESGAIEQDADIVLFIYRAEVYDDDTNTENFGTAELIVAKHRNGPTGTAEVRWERLYASFESQWD